MTEHLGRPERRRQILGAALELFTSLGFEKTSMEQIALKAGLSKGAVYWYYPGKLELMLAVSRDYMDEDVASLDRLAKEKSYGPHALYRVHRDLFEVRLGDPIRGRLLSELMGLTGRYPLIRELFIEYSRRWDVAAADMIQQGMDSGVFRKGDAMMISRAIGAMYQGLCERNSMEGGIDVIGCIEGATRLFFEALTGQQIVSQSNIQ